MTPSPEGLNMTTNTAALPTQTLDEQAATLQRVYDLVGMGALARTPGILLANLENMKRRSDCLSGVEQLFTYEVPDEDMPDEMVDECDLNWGHGRAEYVETFKAALPAFIARNPELALLSASKPADPMGYALVPLIMNREMHEVLSDEGWQWEDLLAAAEAITEEQYNQIAASPAAPALKENQIQVAHTIATAANAATILHGLLDSFVEIAAGFPQAKIDERLADQARIYLPKSAVVLDDERAAFEAAWSRVYDTGDFLLRHHTLTEQYANHDTQRAWEGWKLARAASPQPAVCATCNGHGMIGGPSYYAPDEGGEPCPDCAASPQPVAQTERALLVNLFEVLMQQNIVTSEESYLSLKCVGVPPTEEEFVRAVQRVLDAAQPASGASHE